MSTVIISKILSEDTVTFPEFVMRFITAIKREESPAHTQSLVSTLAKVTRSRGAEVAYKSYGQSAILRNNCLVMLEKVVEWRPPKDFESIRIQIIIGLKHCLWTTRKQLNPPASEKVERVVA